MPVRVLDVLDADALRRWLVASRDALTAARDEIDDLNVYPVPDGDTGTNLLLTVEAAVDAVEQADDDLTSVAAAMARGALMGARGNSGVILSQLLRGLADALADAEACTAVELRAGLRRAAELAYEAVASPVEGTLLTVARECADAADAVAGGVLVDVVRGACSGAARSLQRTPDLLPQLKAAGVVDAGGRGLCVLLEALQQVVTGEAPDVRTTPQLLVPRDRSGLARAREQGSDAYAYEVQYLLHDTTDDAVERLKAALAPLGDSLVVVGGGDLWNVHVHVNDVGAAIEAGIEAGRPVRLTVTRFADQTVDAPLPVMNERPDGRAVVVVAPGEGLAALFTGSGAVVVEGGPSANPSTGELLDAVRRTGAREVVLLPNDGNTLGVAAAAASQARDEGRTTAVVPTRSVLQGLAALAVGDPDRSFADDVAAMAEAAGSTRWAELTTAVREAATMAGICRPGDVLGLLEGDVVLIGTDLERVALDLVDRMLDGGGELVTVVTGEGAPEGVAERLADHVARTRSAVEVVTYEGGQPHYSLLLGVE